MTPRDVPSPPLLVGFTPHTSPNAISSWRSCSCRIYGNSITTLCTVSAQNIPPLSWSRVGCRHLTTNSTRTGHATGDGLFWLPHSACALAQSCRSQASGASRWATSSLERCTSSAGVYPEARTYSTWKRADPGCPGSLKRSVPCVEACCCTTSTTNTK